MKLEPPVNSNYAAVVVKVKTVNELPGLDNLRGTPLLGYQALVGREVEPDTVGIVFTAETQLSEEFCRENNLFRKAELNADPTKTGYLEENRRVRAIKLRQQKSSALFMSLDSLSYTGVDVNDLTSGDTFDKLNGFDVCKKYVIREPKVGKQQPKKERRVEDKLFPAHFDTAQYWRNKDSIPDNAFITVTQKLHGTSIRATNTLVKRKLTLLERIARKFGVKVNEFEYANVYGSRRVVKDPNDPNQDHFYDFDLWTREGAKLDGLIPKGFVIYGELIGFADDSPIQSGYTYQVPRGEAHLYVYRVTRVNDDGYVTDLSWQQVKEFCSLSGLRHVPELWSGYHKDFDPDVFMDIRYVDSGYVQAVPLDPGKTVDEGVCVRAEGLEPTVLKCKAPQFFEFETKLLDKGEVDLESEDG